MSVQFSCKERTDLLKHDIEKPSILSKYNGKKISILGTEYVIVVHCLDDPEFKFKDDSSGYCECFSKELHIKDLTTDNDPRVFDRVEEFCLKVLRHEVIHAFMHESGAQEYCEDERLVNFLALQIPKISSIFEGIGMYNEDLGR